MKNKTIIIFGGSRSEGNTITLIKSIIDKREIEIIDLSNFNISYYDYSHQNRDDDFLPLIKIIVQYERIIFASPVYWYSFSAQMKTFIDRFSDLLSIEKDLGRLLKGKPAYLISSGSDLTYPQCFENQFKLTCDYLGMKYSGIHYCSFVNSNDMSQSAKQEAKLFGERI